MKPSIWTHLLASVCGGLVVAGVLVAVGITHDSTTRTTPDQTYNPGNNAGAVSQTQAPLDSIYRRYAPGVVKVTAIIDRAPRSVVGQHSAGTSSQAAPTVNTGSGFLVSSGRDDYVVTSYHLIEGADQVHGITVQFAIGVSRPATLIRYQDDVAVLKVNTAGITSTVAPLLLGNTQIVQPGDSVIALANPPVGVDRTIKSGIVSALAAQLHSGGVTVNNVIQTDLPAGGTDVGGPLLNSGGYVIGVMGALGGIAFASPIGTATQLLAALSPASH
jgi:S1-C subfamily serine protease